MKKALWALVAFPLLALTPPGTKDEPAGDPVRGMVVYERYCLSCHGERGDGAGEFAEYISPKPRDYRQGSFKWRSTPSGSLPLVSDLEKTVREGAYGTSMPSWYAIGKRNRRDVIAYIQTFSARWKTEKPQEPIPIPPEPPYTEDSANRGRAVYERSACAQCHGQTGLGDGPSARDLKDEWGNANVPYDLTQGHIKCGDTGPDIYRVFMTGLNGTPMPAYKDSISSEDAWDLVHYIQSLSPLYPKNREKATRSR
jgi:mono/diheme cytochrome c family protein